MKLSMLWLPLMNPLKNDGLVAKMYGSIYVKPATIECAIRQTSEILIQNGFEEARLEAEILLSHILGFRRTKLITRLKDSVSVEELVKLNRLTQRRLNREPIAYIIGHQEFFGLEFLVSEQTLIPRPETELLVENALEYIACCSIPDPVIADIGTGCGAIAIALAANLKKAKIYASDISSSALETAYLNVRRHDVEDRVYLLQGDLLEPIPELVDIIVANVPYISEKEMADLDSDVGLFEPVGALYGGKDGLDYISRLIVDSRRILRPNGIILLEIGYQQASAVTAFARCHFPEADISVECDLGGQDRLVKIASQ